MFVETKKEGEAPVVDAVGRLLLNAADALEHYGWRQCDIGGPDRGFCAVGAIIFVQESCTGDAGRAIDRVEVLIKNLVTFNNTLGRTKAEVIGLLRRAASA